MPTSLLAITGVTGHLGRLVATELAAKGRSLRLLARAESVARAPSLDGTELRTASYGDHAAAVAGLRGAAVLFMVSASESADRVADHRTFVAAAAEAGVRHIVYTSFLHASANSTFTLARDHWATEQAIKDSGMAFTFLRDSLYLDFLPLLAGADGVIRGPGGAGVVGAVARADVARAAAAVLASPDDHVGQTYDLTGKETLSLADTARIVREATGKAIAYQPETVAEAHASRARYGAPDWQVEAWISTYSAIATGELATLSDAVQTLTGRAPTTLREFLASQRPSYLAH